MTGVRVASLIRGNDLPQSIPSGGYHIVRFPFGSAESADAWGMHNINQPDGYTIDSDSWDQDDRSGLIWPTSSGWGHLYAMVQFESAGYTELRDQFVRDPLNLSTGSDTTATEHRPPSPGMQCFVKNHGIFVHPGTPIALRVSHNAPGPVNLVLAEFKMVIHPTESP